jgi:hypothetical protein
MTHCKEAQEARHTDFEDIAQQLMSTYNRELHDSQQTAQYPRHEDIDE